MSWCPNCKNEYKDGILICADCGAALVDSLKESDSMQTEEIESDEEWMQEETPLENDTDNKPVSYERYIDPAQKAEDYRTGANALISVGIVGMIALLLLNTGLIPISLAGYTKGMVNSIMGALFVLFLILGLSSRKSYRQWKEKSSAEETLRNELKEWLQHAVKQSIGDELNITEGMSREEIYFMRTNSLKEAAKSHNGDLKENMIDYVIEEIYPSLFEEP